MDGEHGDKVEYFIMDLMEPRSSSCCPRSLFSPISLVLHILTASRMFWESLPCIRSHAPAGHMVQHFVTGLMVVDRRFPGATILGASSSTPSANHPFSVPPTSSEFRYALVCGRCTRFQALNVQTGSMSWFLGFCRRCGVPVVSCCGQRQSEFGSTLRRPWLAVAAAAIQVWSDIAESLCFFPSVIGLLSSFIKSIRPIHGSNWSYPCLHFSGCVGVVSVMATPAPTSAATMATAIISTTTPNRGRRRHLCGCAQHVAHITAFKR